MDTLRSTPLNPSPISHPSILTFRLVLVRVRMLEALMVEACLIRVILTSLIINPEVSDLLPCSPASFSDVLRVTSAVASFIYRLFFFLLPCFPGGW